MRHIANAHLEQLLLAVAGDGAHLLVDAQEAAVVRIGLRHADGRHLERGTELLLALLHGGDGLLALGDVVERGDEQIAARAHRDFHVAPLAVLAGHVIEAQRRGTALAEREGQVGLPLGLHRLAVVRIGIGAHEPCFHRRRVDRCITVVCDESLVAILNLPQTVGDADGNRQKFERRAEPFLALAQDGLGLFALGDIGKDGRPTARPPRRHRDGEVLPQRLEIDFQIRRPAGLADCGILLQEGRAIATINLGRQPAHHPLPLQTDNFFIGSIDFDQPVIGRYAVLVVHRFV